MTRISMKILNRIESPKLVTPSNRLNTAFRFTPPRKIAGSARSLSSNSLDPDGALPNGNGLRIQNFCYHAPTAKSVQLLGDFTNWLERPMNLRKKPGGMWWTAIRLGRGTHYYRFLVDGQWCDDPECSLVVPNPFGTLNAVRQVL